MFHQIVAPIGGNLSLSLIVGTIAVVLLMLVVLRRSAWQVSIAGLIVGLAIGLTLLLGGSVILQQYVLSGMIPTQKGDCPFPFPCPCPRSLSQSP